LFQIIINGLVLGSLYCLIALGITLIFSIMGVLNFAHGQMYMIGGFVIYYLYGQFNLHIVLSLIACAFILGAIGAAFYHGLFRRVIEKSTEDSTMLLAIGSALLLEESALLLFGEKTRGVQPVVEGVFTFMGTYLVAERLFVMGVAFILIVALLLFVKKTKLGMAMRALSQDREGAFLQGVDIHKISGYGFAIGAALAGLAGGLLAPTFMINPGIGSSISLKSFIIMMLGGFGSVPGAIVGGFLLGFMEAFGNAYLPVPLVYLIIFLSIIILLIVRPQGIMGKPAG
jgi:branched-chain amino acid transport system permease protein